MYKFSMYNHCCDVGDYMLVYNYYSSSIIKVEKGLFETLYHKNLECISPDFLKFLLEQGVLVGQDVDESALGEFQFYKNTYQNVLSITIMPTEQCNFRCRYCYENFRNGNLSQETIQGLEIFLKKNIQNFRRVHFDWFGGEPLLVPELIEQISNTSIDLCRRYGKVFSAGITTNGYLLTPSMLARMLSCKITNYQITLDGLEEHHNFNRPLINGTSTYKKIMENLNSIRASVGKSTFKIIVRTNITKELLPHLTECLKIYQQTFEEDTRFEFYFRPVGDWGGERVKNIENNLVTSFVDFYQPILESKVSVNVSAYLNLLKNRVCNAGNMYDFVLRSDGTIYKCTMLLDADFNRIGRLEADGRLELDQTKLARWVAGRPAPHHSCETCQNWNLCFNRACAAKVFTQDQNSSPNCGHEIKSIDYVLRLLDQTNAGHIAVYGKS